MTHVFKSDIIDSEKHVRMSVIKEELIRVACHPRHVLWYHKDVLTDKTHPLYGVSKDEINALCNIK